jgi:hypothetical protein
MDALTRLGTAAASDPSLLARLSGPVLREVSSLAEAFWKRGQQIGAVRTDLPVAILVAIATDLKTSLTRTLLPSNRTASRAELNRFMRIHVDLLRRATELKKEPLRSKGKRS